MCNILKVIWCPRVLQHSQSPSNDLFAMIDHNLRQRTRRVVESTSTLLHSPPPQNVHHSPPLPASEKSSSTPPLSSTPRLHSPLPAIHNSYPRRLPAPAPPLAAALAAPAPLKTVQRRRQWADLGHDDVVRGSVLPEGVTLEIDLRKQQLVSDGFHLGMAYVILTGLIVEYALIEGQPPGDHLVQQNTQRPDIRLGVVMTWDGLGVQISVLWVS